MNIEKANYQEAILPEHKGNPWIEALPKKVGTDKIMDKFSNYPELDVHVREDADPLVRAEYTIRLKALRQPLPLYAEVFRAIETTLKDGYSSKNPFTPTTAQYLHYPSDKRPQIAPKTGYFVSKAECITLIGDSGVGKTSMLEQVLNYFPTVIMHDNYHGKKMEYQRQIVWIKVDCPNNSSVRDLCKKILVCIDNIVQEGKTKPATKIEDLTDQIEQKIKVNFLGMLVIDEVQRLTFKKTGGENNLLNFIHTLVNKLGIPMLFCANPPFDNTLAKVLKAARRAEGGGYFIMKQLARDSQEWDCFIEELWDLHWTNVTTELTEELNNTIFELSVGNLDMAHRIYRAAQRLVIGSGDERITDGVLRQAALSALGLSSRTKEVIDLRAEITMPRRNRQATNNAVIDSEANVNIKTHSIADITRPQHPEFSKKLIELASCVDLISRIDDPDLLRRGVDEDDANEYFRSIGILCDDPLKQLA
ncbi:ATP-binding protein [Paraglaciecola chathamensis]|uniref:ATPase n=1 Tax=Paraglaciecola chathamensis S18K6 TaxID=1127672 RepID=A0AAV3UT58_9ALTE|nr:ATP-binding protein [Paraglaciecola chathamensis]GAC08260.1 ATPase [Paraglaciecola chathamensis S18K6]